MRLDEIRPTPKGERETSFCIVGDCDWLKADVRCRSFADLRPEKERQVESFFKNSVMARS